MARLPVTYDTSPPFRSCLPFLSGLLCRQERHDQLYDHDNAKLPCQFDPPFCTLIFMDYRAVISLYSLPFALALRSCFAVGINRRFRFDNALSVSRVLGS